MKNIIFALLALFVLQSCSISKKLNRRKDISAVTSHMKTDSAGTKHVDSTGESKIATNKGTRTVEGIDTNLVVPGDTMAVVADLPDTGRTEVFTEGDQTIELGRNATGKITVKATIKTKVIPVHETKTTESWDNSTLNVAATVHRDETSHVTNDAKVDSSRKVVTAVKAKETHSFGGWRLWIIVAIVALFIAWKIYSKGANPSNWFKTRKIFDHET